MSSERFTKQVVFEEVERGNGYSGRQERDWMCCLESLYTGTEVANRALGVVGQEAGYYGTGVPRTQLGSVWNLVRLDD